jgi:hypothetical protein
VVNDSALPSELNGGDGVDEVLGGPARDRLSGADGGLVGDGAADTVSGRGGDDSFMMVPTDGNDVLDGGQDLDDLTVQTFFLQPDPLLGHFTLGDGAANDGWDAQAGKLNDIEDVSVVDNFNPVTNTETGTNQIIRGSSADNVLTAGSGNDNVDGLAGSDKLDLSAGDDTAEARDGFQDRVKCGAGNDTARLDQLDEESGCENVERTFVQPFGTLPPANAAPALAGCPSGKNLITLSAGDDERTGTTGADLIFAGAGNDSVNGGGGDDCIDLGTGNDDGEGGDGGDLILGGLGNDALRGVEGSDRLSGDAGDDKVLGGDGNDGLLGGSGADRLFGESGADRMHGQAGDDLVSGQGGRDRINGGAGADTLYGGSSADVVNGDAGNDRLTGGGSRDILRGNSGRDRIFARDGSRDRITCGTGRDRVSADRIDRVARDCERVRRG